MDSMGMKIFSFKHSTVCLGRNIVHGIAFTPVNWQSLVKKCSKNQYVSGLGLNQRVQIHEIKNCIKLLQPEGLLARIRRITGYNPLHLHPKQEAWA